MATANLIIGILLVIMAVFLVISVLMQSSKDHRLSGSIAGGAETFFGKTKGKSLDAFFSKTTTIVTIIFVILVLLLYIIQPENSTLANQENVIGGEEVSDVIDNADDANAQEQQDTDADADAGTDADAGADAQTEVPTDAE